MCVCVRVCARVCACARVCVRARPACVCVTAAAVNTPRTMVVAQRGSWLLPTPTISDLVHKDVMSTNTTASSSLCGDSYSQSY